MPIASSTRKRGRSGGERRSRPHETNIAMLSGRRKVRPVMPYNIYSKLPLLRSGLPSRRSIGFPSLRAPRPTSTSILDSLRWTFLNRAQAKRGGEEGGGGGGVVVVVVVVVASLFSLARTFLPQIRFQSFPYFPLLLCSFYRKDSIFLLFKKRKIIVRKREGNK